MPHFVILLRFAVVLVCLATLAGGCTSDPSSTRPASTSHDADITQGPLEPINQPFHNGRPTRPLRVDMIKQYGIAASLCAPHCEEYRRIRLRRERAAWEAFSDGRDRAIVVFGENQCSGAEDEVVVNGSTLEIFQYYAIDPRQDDKVSVDMCRAVGGQCGSPCTTFRVHLGGRSVSDLRHAGAPRRQPSCEPWPECLVRVRPRD